MPKAPVKLPSLPPPVPPSANSSPSFLPIACALAKRSAVALRSSGGRFQPPVTLNVAPGTTGVNPKMAVGTISSPLVSMSAHRFWRRRWGQQHLETVPPDNTDIDRRPLRSGVDVGPWLVANEITVVSTVPTLVSLWPTEALDGVRLLILGGEACPPEIGERLARGGREVWNTYGPTEATVVACGARLEDHGPVRIGLPLDGWDLAVVDELGDPVPDGDVGELIVGGVGLARYLDPAKDAEKYAAMPTLGWERAYRTGDRVRFDGAGLLFAGRADDQVKLGGRRIELGEVDSALLSLPGVVGAAAAVRRSRAGNQLLVGYVTVDDGFDPSAAAELLRDTVPAALVPRLAPVADLPTRTSGKIDRDALPWPLPTSADAGDESSALSGTAVWIAELWLDVLGAVVRRPTDDFFDLGGGSLTAAQMVSRLRARFPEVTVADLYESPTVGALAAMLDGLAAPSAATNRRVRPTPSKTQVGQVVFTLPLRLLSGLRWLTWVLLANNVLAASVGPAWLPTVSWWWPALGVVLLVLAPGRMALSALGARWLLRRVAPGDYPRGGRTHLRLWLAERLADELGAANVAGAALLPTYARLLGAKVGKDVDLHSFPPVTGRLSLGKGCSVEPEVDLSGYWLDGDVLRIGAVRVGAGARVGTRSTLGPGAVIGKGSEVAPGSAVLGEVGRGELWSGSPAEPISRARGPWSSERPARSPRWVLAYAGLSTVIAALPVLALAAGLAVALPGLTSSSSVADALGTVLPLLPVSALVAGAALALLVLLLCRLLGRGSGAGPLPGPQPAGPAGLGHAAGPRRGPHLAVPALRELADPGVAPAPRRPDRRRGGGVDRAADPEADDGQRPGVPRRRHPDRQLRARWRLAAGGAREDRQAGVRRQLRDGSRRPQGAQAVARGGALRGAGSQGGRGRGVVARQPARHAAPAASGPRRHPDL